MTTYTNELIHGDTRVPHLTFAVSRRTNLPSFVTRVMTSGALWSHSAFFDMERGEMIEALLPYGTQPTPVDEWVERYPSFEFFAVPVPRPADGVAYARSRLGQTLRRDLLLRKRMLPKIRYDVWGATSAPWRGDWQDSDRDYCSEQCTVICLHAGLQLFYDHNLITHRRGVSPHEFWRAARAVGQVPRLELAA